MSLLAASCLPREVRVCVHRPSADGTGPGLDPVWLVGRCAPPPVWAAIAVLSAENLDAEALRDVVRAWMPWHLADQVLELSDDALLEVLRSLVAYTAGLTDGDRARAAEALRETEARAEGVQGTEAERWDTLVCETAVELRYPLREMLDLPWPAFLALARSLGPVRAAEGIRATQVASYPHLTAESQRNVLQSLRKAAGVKPPPQATVDAEAARRDADHVRRQVEAFLACGSTLYGDAPTAEA